MKLFKEWINRHSKLAIFDFDRTLANTPIKPDDYKGEDWYSSNVSMAYPYYNGEMHKKIVDIFRKYKQNPNIKVVMLTGRQNVISDKVRSLLKKNNLHGKRVMPQSNPEYKKYQHHRRDLHSDAHDEYYKGDHSTEPDYPLTKHNKPNQDTLVFKSYIINKLMNDNYVELEIFEDRDEHIPEFINLCKLLLQKYKNLQKVIINHVISADKIRKIELL